MARLRWACGIWYILHVPVPKMGPLARRQQTPPVRIWVRASPFSVSLVSSLSVHAFLPMSAIHPPIHPWQSQTYQTNTMPVLSFPLSDKHPFPLLNNRSLQARRVSMDVAIFPLPCAFDTWENIWTSMGIQKRSWHGHWHRPKDTDTDTGTTQGTMYRNGHRKQHWDGLGDTTCSHCLQWATPLSPFSCTCTFFFRRKDVSNPERSPGCRCRLAHGWDGWAIPFFFLFGTPSFSTFLSAFPSIHLPSIHVFFFLSLVSYPLCLHPPPPPSLFILLSFISTAFSPSFRFSPFTPPS